MTVIGITGGTGAGKTTALEAVRQLGGVILDCDVIYHELLESDQQLLGQIRAHFPDAFPDGKFDRKALGAIVFQDPGALADLTAITGRYVCQEVQGRLAEYEAQGIALAAIDAKIYGPLHLGWSVRYKRRLTHSEGSLGNVWYVPGFGKQGSTRLGGTFDIILEF